MQLLQEKTKYPVSDFPIPWASGAKGRAFESRRAHQNGIKDLDVKI